MARYIEIQEKDVPDGVRFDVPRSNQGQMVEVAYGGFGRAEHGSGDPYKRVVDKSERTTRYYQLEQPAQRPGPAGLKRRLRF